jgi:hypothetical protein
MAMSDQVSPSTPSLAAVRVVGAGGVSVIAAWCPWCEAVHTHGAGADGERGAHCRDYRAGSPLTAYRLDVQGRAGSIDGARPAGAFVGRRQLITSLGSPWLGSSGLTRDVARALLGRSVRAGFHRSRLPDGTHLELISLTEWRIVDRAGDAIAEGAGLVSLAGRLYGVGAGVAAVRIFEAVTGHALDRIAARELEAVITRWQARGGRGREP